MILRRSHWYDLRTRYGHLQASAEVVVAGRRTATRGWIGWLWLPGADGRIAEVAAVHPASLSKPRPAPRSSLSSGHVLPGRSTRPVLSA